MYVALENRKNIDSFKAVKLPVSSTLATYLMASLIQLLVTLFNVEIQFSFN